MYLKSAVIYLVVVIGLLLFSALGCVNNPIAKPDSNTTRPSGGTLEKPIEAVYLDKEFVNDSQTVRRKYTGVKLIVRGEVEYIRKESSTHAVGLLGSLNCTGSPYGYKPDEEYNAKIDGIDDLKVGDEATLSGIFSEQSEDLIHLFDCEIVAFTSRGLSPRESPATSELPVKLIASDLLAEYEQNPLAAKRKYKQDKLVVVTGRVMHTGELMVTLEGGVTCDFSNSGDYDLANLNDGRRVILTGTSSGFYPLFNRLGQRSKTPHLKLRDCRAMQP